MPTWALWTTLAILIWVALAGLVTPLTARAGVARRQEATPPGFGPAEAPEARQLVSPSAWAHGAASADVIRILVVDDDPGLRALVRTTFEAAHIHVEEADGAAAAAAAISRTRPDAIVLDVAMPVTDGITFCRRLKSDLATQSIPVMLLTGDAISDDAGREAGADAFLRKPFSPLALLASIEGLAVRRNADAPQPEPHQHYAADEQLLLYAQDFRLLLELERGQRVLLEQAYRETAVALARALESKDGHTAAHCDRVRRYASELAAAADPDLLTQPGLEYGFILHDVGKIGIPDAVLAKPGPLSDSERRLLQTHPILGQQMIGQAALLRGHGSEIVRSHHERWDGKGYPDRLARDDIPIGARIFAIADTLDAITSDRPYRPANSWETAMAEIVAQAGAQFDPDLVQLLLEREEVLRRIYYEVSSTDPLSRLRREPVGADTARA
jgi:response regulator RpfG family c-di-GMP phosphodiesterase